MPDDVEHDEVTGEEIHGTVIPRADDAQGPSQSKRPANAFSALMAKKPRVEILTKGTKTSTTRHFVGRDGLGAYITDPTAFSSKQVIYHNEHAVMINDLYPKATVHTLVLPRDPEASLKHPFDAFEDASFLATVKLEVAKAKDIVASELQRRFGPVSASDRARNEAMEADDPPTELPPGRDWASEVRVGIHAHPSMSHLHVHVFSPDMVSECLRHRKHYMTFNTPFLVPLDAFPLLQDDPRRHPGRAGYLDQDMKCWRCGKEFGNKFAKLKQHLTDELETWKRM